MSRQVKVVYYVRKKYLGLMPPVDEIKEETIIVDDLVVIQWDPFGLHMYYKDMDRYLSSLKYSVEDIETDIQIVDLGEF